MKFQTVIIGIVLSLCIFGCATQRTLVPGTPYQPATTNTDGTINPAVPAVPAVVTNVPNKTVTDLVTTGHEVAPFIPAPWGGILDGGLALAAIIAGAVAKSKNKQLNTANAVTATVVQGVEAAGALAGAVKSAIKSRALANGTSDAVHAAVLEHAPEGEPLPVVVKPVV